VTLLKAELLKSQGSEYYSPKAVSGFLDKALANYRSSSLSRQTLCVALKMQLEVEPAPASEIQSSFAPFLGDLWKLQFDELIRLCRIEELRQIGSKNLARRFLAYALSVSTYNNDLLLVATRLKACFGDNCLDNNL
jgi:hypothetical protein